MAKVTILKTGAIGLIQQQPDGTLKQVGISPEQNQLLQEFLKHLSSSQPFILMPEEYDLFLKSEKN